MVLETFLLLNKATLLITDAAAYDAMIALAAGRIDQRRFAATLRPFIKRRR